MPHFKITLAYDGTPYHGWQIQPGLATVQGTLAEAIHRIADERVLPQGSGRTDTGVHALGQVASVTVVAPIPAERLHRALNHCLPNSIRVLGVEETPETFHARHSAVSKTYEYRIFPAHGPNAICPPTLAPFVWPCPWPLEIDAMQCAAARVIGTHDFTAFAAAPSSAEDTPATYVRTITHSQWEAKGDLLLYRVSGSGFLHRMVRNLVGTFVQCCAGRRDPNSIAALLASRDRTLAGPTAPPTGLFLVSVDYPPFKSSASQHVEDEEAMQEKASY
ncbi:MAG TPA: tRNA pseudouridine(38-40) synthase TruA [Acidobacteriaceae bacterium]